MTTPVRTTVAALAELVWPDHCAGCGRLGARWCAGCAAALADGLFGVPRWVRPDPCPAGMPPVVAAGPYAGRLRAVLHAYKDGERRDLLALLAPILAVVIEEARGGRPMLVMPVPASRSSVRRRGDRPLEDLVAAALALTVPTTPETMLVPRALALRRRVRDQSTLTAMQRAANLAGAIEVTDGWADAVAGLPVLLVDDIVTTGATVTACADALRRVGAGPVSVAALAATRRRQHSANNLLPSGNSY